MSSAQATASLIGAVLVVFAVYASGLLGSVRPGGTEKVDSASSLAAQLRAQGQPVALGDRVTWLLLRDEADVPVRHDIPADGRPVVIWFWSCLCRCVRDCEERIVSLLKDYPPERVHFFAVDCNPDDSALAIQQLRTSMGSPYEVFRDVDWATASLLGVDASASVAVLDGEGRLRFRGAIDDDRYDPTVSYVRGALDAIFAERAVDPETAPSYGCRYPILNPQR